MGKDTFSKIKILFEKSKTFLVLCNIAQFNL